MRDDRTRLQDDLEAVERIGKHAARGRAAFVLGEAASGLSVDFRKRHPERVWAEAIGRRNILIHRYFGVEADLIWPVVEEDLPGLKRMVQDILAGEYPAESA